MVRESGVLRFEPGAPGNEAMLFHKRTSLHELISFPTKDFPLLLLLSLLLMMLLLLLLQKKNAFWRQNHDWRKKLDLEIEKNFWKSWMSAKPAAAATTTTATTTTAASFIIERDEEQN